MLIWPTVGAGVLSKLKTFYIQIQTFNGLKAGHDGYLSGLWRWLILTVFFISLESQTSLFKIRVKPCCFFLFIHTNLSRKTQLLKPSYCFPVCPECLLFLCTPTQLSGMSSTRNVCRGGKHRHLRYLSIVLEYNFEVLSL